MKDNWQKILNIATVVLLVICVVRIGWIENELSNIRNTMRNNRSMLQSSIDAISSNVRYEMEQANNILSDSSWNTGGLNIEDKTATLYCYVVPKVYNPEKTVAAIIFNGEEIPMTLEGGRYTAEIIMPLFDASVVDNVQFKEDGTIRTQQLNWVIDPRYDMVPTAYVHYSGESRQNYNGANITRTYKGWAEIDFEHKGFTEIDKDAEIVFLINGKEEWRHKPVLEEQYGDEYISHYVAEIEQSFELKRGDTIEMYVEFTDSNGWKYHSVVEDVTISEKGNPVPNREYYQAEADIYDSDGNLLFQPYKY